MSDIGLYDYALNGFTDYSKHYESLNILWLNIGILVFLGTFISLLPQKVVLLKKASSNGLNVFSVASTSLNQFLVLVNLLCLTSTKIIGMFQYPFFKCVPALMTIINAFALWYAYLPVVYLMYILYDRRDDTEFRYMSYKSISYFFIIATFLMKFLLLLFYFIGVCKSGLGGSFLDKYGQITGTAAAVVVTVQYIPQIITTFRMKDKGSLSIIMLAIQTPGGIANTLFIALGQGEHWTTWLSYLAAAIEQGILLFLCVYFEILKKVKANQMNVARVHFT